MKLIKVLGNSESRMSGNGSFPPPNKNDIGREVIITRRCITWNGNLGYFKDDEFKITHAFHDDEIEVKYGQNNSNGKRQSVPESETLSGAV